ncbi:uncharacterized protein [Diabrotica undecimpunctata]|uniref:uncharacterized protein n=1 Tax=Diabrotica undecimpunctata TaxID=50387 RepID=UPI003B63B2FE
MPPKRKGGQEKKLEREKKKRCEIAKKCHSLDNLLNSYSVPSTSGVESDINTEKQEQEQKSEENLPVSETKFETELKLSEDSDDDIETSDESDSEANVKKALKDEEALLKLGQPEETESGNFFDRPDPNKLQLFFEFHPKVPVAQKDIPFNVEKAFTRNNKTKRKWLSYSEERKALFCTICLAYSVESNKDQSSAFARANEAAYNLENENLDHGNFLEIILLLSKFDVILKKHLDAIVKKSKSYHNRKIKRRAGNFYTFLSKTTVNSIIVIITEIIQKKISSEIQTATMFSIEIDSTQDISVTDQCSVVTRYVYNGTIHERLLAVVPCHNSTGKGFHTMIHDILVKNGLDEKNCIADSTDGAANMQGRYSGFSSFMVQENSNHVHVWCYAHILNLVLTDIFKSHIKAASFFSLLNCIAAFFKESHQRMGYWLDIGNNARSQKLQLIGETRWWSKEAALSKIFGNFNEPNKALIVFFNVIADTAVESISRRFANNAELCRDLSILDPNNFEEIAKGELPENSLKILSEKLIQFDSSATPAKLKEELASFASNWKHIKLTIEDSYEVNYARLDVGLDDSSSAQSDVDEDDCITKQSTKSRVCIESNKCQNCVICCYGSILKYNLFKGAYSTLVLAYQYILSLPISQVACERSFSTLKFIKNRLRNSLSDNRLESFMLMNIENDILSDINNDEIINRLGQTTKLMKDALMY